MPIKLNPCRVCGGKAGIAHWDRSRGVYHTYVVYCNQCGNQISKGARKQADAAWNAANPKEDEPK